MTTSASPVVDDRVTFFADENCWGTVTEADSGTVLVLWDNGNEHRYTPEAVKVRTP